MNKEEIFNIFYGKETLDIWRKFQELESSIDESEFLYKYFDDIKKMLFYEKSYRIKALVKENFDNEKIVKSYKFKLPKTYKKIDIYNH